MADKRKVLNYLIGLFFVVAYIVELFFIFQLNPYACEDAYITYRYSANMAQGYGPVFNPGDRVEGYSNFIWMAGLSIAHALGFDMAAMSRIAGGIFNTFSLLLVWYIPRRYFGIKGLQGVIAPLLYLLFLPFHFYATAGLETSLYTLLILLCLYTLLWAENRPLPMTVSGFFFLLLALTRPEGIIFFAFLCCYWIWRRLAAKESLQQYLPAFILFCVCYGAFILWRLSYYELPFPNTYYAKGTLPLFIRVPLGAFITKGFFTHYPHFLIFLFTFFGFVKTNEKKHAIRPVIIFIVAGLLFSIGFSGFDWMPFFRYNVPIVPLFIIISQIVSTEIWNRLTLKGRAKQKLVWAALVVFLVFLASEQFVQDIAFNLRWKGINDFAYHNHKVLGEWIKKELGNKPVIAIGDVGRLAFFSQATILDIFGLTNKEFAQLKKNYGAPDIRLPFGEISFDSYKAKERALLLKLLPDYIFLYNAQLKISDTFTGSAAGIADYPEFLEHYDYMATLPIIPGFMSQSWPKLIYSIDVLDLSTGLLSWIRNGWGYDIYIRKNSPFKKFAFEFNPDEKIKRVYELKSD